MSTRIIRQVRVDVALRMVVGAVLLLAGLAKLFAPFATARIIESHGISDGLAVGIVAGVCEACAGALILLGWFVDKTAFIAVILYAPIALVFHYRLDHVLDVAFDVAVIAGLWILATRPRPQKA
jgi:uncharacterized membrane protein YphA (DoxX/SURF4 family)